MCEEVLTPQLGPVLHNKTQRRIPSPYSKQHHGVGHLSSSKLHTSVCFRSVGWKLKGNAFPVSERRFPGVQRRSAPVSHRCACQCVLKLPREQQRLPSETQRSQEAKLLPCKSICHIELMCVIVYSVETLLNILRNLKHHEMGSSFVKQQNNREILGNTFIEAMYYIKYC